jgi:MarR family transcriptional regulator for hemolysin
LTKTSPVRPKNLAGDPVPVQALREISIISHIADVAFQRMLPEGLTTAQFSVLNRLERLKKRETIGEMARAFRVAQPTMSSTVAKLEAKGLVALEPDPTDGRVRYVVGTEAGRAIRAAGIEKQVEELKSVGDALTAADWEQLLTLSATLRAWFDDRV